MKKKIKIKYKAKTYEKPLCSKKKTILTVGIAVFEATVGTHNACNSILLN